MGRGNSVISIDSVSSVNSGYSYEDTMQRRPSGSGVYVHDSYSLTEPGLPETVYRKASAPKQSETPRSSQTYSTVASRDRTIAANVSDRWTSHRTASGHVHQRAQKSYYFPKETAQMLDDDHAKEMTKSNSSEKVNPGAGNSSKRSSLVSVPAKEGGGMIVRVIHGSLNRFNIDAKEPSVETDPEEYRGKMDGKNLRPVRRLVRKHRHRLMHGTS